MTVTVIGETLVVIDTIPTKGASVLTAEIAVITNALDQFVVKGITQGGSTLTLKSLSTDYTSPAGIVTDASGNLLIIAADASGWLVLDVRGFEEIQLWAASDNVGGSTVTTFIGMSQNR